jgi:cytochrome c peroxidase
VDHKDCCHVVSGRPADQGFSWVFRLTLTFCLALFTSGAHGQKLRIEIEPQWRCKPFVLGSELSGSKVPGLSVSRFDGLLSDLELQRSDGTWLKSGQWHVFFSAAKPRLSCLADGLPAEEFSAIRFRVGLDAATDTSDASLRPPGHPLHPDVCGLHWGWNSGYVFMAIEGHWGKGRGYSYHLAGQSKPMIVQLPLHFSGGSPTTVRLGFELATVLADGEVVAGNSSTHSREGDTFAEFLKERVTRAFEVKSVRSDIYQEIEIAGASPVAIKGTPYRLNVSDRLPRVQLPADNPLTVEGVELGRTLFNDPRLSKNNAQSCASCHDYSRAFTDGRETSIGVEGKPGRRNAMPLMNLAWAKEFFWDGRARSLREQVLMPIQDAHEMNERLEAVVAKLRVEREYGARFNAAFGSTNISADRMALALEQYLLTLISQESKFDRAARKLEKLTAEEQRGLQLFVTEHDPARGLRGADCFHCHGGNLFSNHQFMNNGLAERAGDLGRMEASGDENDRGKFKVPSLRNVSLTAPYMHDGRFATLEEVIEHYNGSLHRTRVLDPNLAKHPGSGMGLSTTDKAALVAFLKTLTDESFITEQSPSNQFTKTR